MSMEWRDLEVWRRQRLYVSRELRKDAPDHLARLGLATSFTLAVGMLEGARLSALKGDLRFPLRYAVYNVIPSFVGGKVPPSSVASTMATPPPLRACPRAVAHATNLRALRTAVAGCTVLSILFQISLAGNRGTEAYEQAVSEGREVPSLSANKSSWNKKSAGVVVRLCGTEGLESALVAPRRAEYRTPILPVVVSGPTTCPGSCSSSPGSSLPDGARAAIAKHSPRPCYYRIDPRRLFCQEAWRPVGEEIVAAARWKDEDVVLVFEADALSSDAPHALFCCPVGVATTVGVRDGVGDRVGGRVSGRIRDRVSDGVRVSGSGGGSDSVSGSDSVGDSVSVSVGGSISDGVRGSGRVGGRVGESELQRGGWLGTDQAVWGLAMLRRILEEGSGSGRVAGVLLAERRLADVGDSTVSIDARAALLLSVFSWAQQCVAEALAREELEEEGAGGGGFLGETGVADEAAVKRPECAERRTSLPDEETGNAPARAESRKKVAQAVEVNVAGTGSDNGGRINVPRAVEMNVAGTRADGDSGSDTEGESSRRDTAAGEAGILGDAPSDPDQRENSNTTARALAFLEMIGRGVRAVVAPDGRVRDTINRSIGVVSAGLASLRRCVVGDGGERRSRVLVYDTDDEESYRWLAAQMLRHGWTVRRAGSHHDNWKTPGRFGGGSDRDVPVLVHRCSDEKTLTAAAGHLSRGPPVCAVVHRWDCGAEARRLLLGGGRGEPGARAEGRHVSTAVICTAEVGEDLFQFVRGQLQSGASPEQVQEVVDDLFGGFYDEGSL